MVVSRKKESYSLGMYQQCCYSGACAQYYFYRTGLWKFYDGEGCIDYELEFEPSELHITTNCEGGDELIFGLVKSVPLDYMDKVTANMIFESQKVIMKTENWTEILIPINGILMREMIE